MSANGEDCHLVFTHKFSYIENLFFYAAGENNVDHFIQFTPEIADTPESYIIDEDVVDTMGDDMMDAMELKNGKICDDYGYRCGK